MQSTCFRHMRYQAYRSRITVIRIPTTKSQLKGQAGCRDDIMAHSYHLVWFGLLNAGEKELLPSRHRHRPSLLQGALPSHLLNVASVVDRKLLPPWKGCVCDAFDACRDRNMPLPIRNSESWRAVPRHTPDELMGAHFGILSVCSFVPFKVHRTCNMAGFRSCMHS